MKMQHKLLRHPVQTPRYRSGTLNSEVTARAYEVYEHLYGGRQTLARLNERGGLSVGEVIALLYARTYPKEEWRDRESLAFKLMELS